MINTRKKALFFNTPDGPRCRALPWGVARRLWTASAGFTCLPMKLFCINRHQVDDIAAVETQQRGSKVSPGERHYHLTSPFRNL